MLTDVCKAVGIGNAPHVASRLNDDEKDAIIINDSAGRPNRCTIVNRPGLTKVLRRSTKPEARAAAEPFDQWVLHDVLETIYETGSYTAPGAPPADTRLAEILDRMDQRAAERDAAMFKTLENITALCGGSSGGCRLTHR